MQKLTFEDRYDSINYEIEKRRARWDVGTVDFDDAKQIILVRIWRKYHTFNESKIIDDRPVEFVHWVNRVITHAIYNIWRASSGNSNRPCVGNSENGHCRCVFNGGDDLCTKTPSGKQCAECPLFKDWERRKKSQHAIKHTLSLEHHAHEANSIQSDFLDIKGKKALIDAEMKKCLEPHEWRVYKHLIIKGGSEEEAAKLLGFKQRAKTKNGRKPKTYAGYSAILKLRKMFVELAKRIIENENLA